MARQPCDRPPPVWGMLVMRTACTPEHGRSEQTMTRPRRWIPILGLTAAVVLLLLLGNHVLRSLVILPSFLELEEVQATTDVSRCVDAIKREEFHLATLAADWAMWDDTYRFVQDRNTAFVESNLRWPTLEQSSGLNLLFFCEPSGKVVWGGIYDSTRGGGLVSADLPTDRVRPDHPLLHHQSLDETVTGVVLTDLGPLLVSSRPIVTTARTGPSQGVLIMGRFVDRDMVDALREQTRVSFDLTPIVPGMLSARQRGLLSLLDRNGPQLEPISDEELEASTLIRDLSGRPALLLTASIPRHIMARGREAATSASYSTLLTVVGTVAACSVLFMLILGLHARASTEAGEVRWILRDALTFAPVVGIGLALALGAFAITRHWEGGRLEERFLQAAAERVSLYELRLETLLGELQALRRFHESSQRVSREEFQSFAQPLLEANPEIFALRRVAWVEGGQREAFERQVRADGYAGFAIREQGPKGSLVPSPARAQYYPISDSVARDAEPEVLGLDLGARPDALALLDRACASGLPVASTPFRLAGRGEDQVAFQLVLPIYRAGTHHGDAAERRAALDGFVVALVAVGPSFEGMISKLVPAGIDVDILDLSVPDSERVLYHHDSRLSLDATDGPGPTGMGSGAGLSLVSNLEAADHTWQLVCKPTPEFLTANRHWNSWIVLATGLLLTVWLFMYVAGSRRRTARIEALVEARTAKLDESRQMLRNVLDTIPVRVWWKGRDLKYLGCNEHFARDAGLTSSPEIVGKTDADLLWSEQAEGVQERDRQVLASGKPVFGQITPTHTTAGAERILEITKIPLLAADGTVEGLLGSYGDITEQRRAAEDKTRLEEQLRQSQKMEAIGQLAGGIAHDFNNLLTGITGNVSLALLRLGDDHPLANKLKEIGSIAQRAANLTRQLLAFSRRQIIEPRVVDLADTIADLQDMLARVIGETVRLHVENEEGLGRIRVDPGQIEQVIVNLCVNARDAMVEGGVLSIATANVELDETYAESHADVAPGAYVMLSVSDTGCGMDADTRSHMFEPFFTTKPKDKGTGLGLATVYGAVKQNRGSIEVYSELGRGTTFKVYFPRVEEEVRPGSGSYARTDLPGGTETVLFVEDEPTVREAAIDILDFLGYRVLQAPNGIEALAIAEEHGGAIDLLLTDVVMPGMTGHDLAKRLLKRNPTLKVLFSSGYTSDVIVDHGVLADGVNFIGKPYTPHALANKLREVLDGKPDED